MKHKYLLIIQARINSKRLPGKVLMKLGKYTIIEFLYKRLIKSKKIDKVIVATTTNKTDDILCDYFDNLNIHYFRGSENNVLKRFYDTAFSYKAKNIIRITADCPFVDIKMMDKMISIFEKNKVDYLSNSFPPTFPDGLDIEIFNYKSLKNAFKNAKSKYDKEHVTSYIKINKKLKILNYENKINLSKYRWTLDEALDYKLIKKIYEKLNNNIYFTWKDILKLEEKNPQFFSINMKIKRNQGSELSSSQKLWKRALKVIPNGNMFLSKNPNQFLPDIWPAYFTKSKDSFVWDLDNKKYFDFCTMGVGTNILGYSNKFVDKAVKESISKGNMSSLNCPEEVLLSEKLISIHNDFDQVRLARTGGEANSIAIRIARANTNKQKVLICGYHGWHDWYLAANLSNKKNLDKHLLPGLSPLGVPKFLKNTTFTFQYNDFEDFKNKIESDDEIGIVKMEVVRTFEPKKNFLKKIRDYTKKKNIILIFDECTTGFRENFGGLYKKYKVVPDLVIFGKAIGNGYPITAILGREELMLNSKKSFLSSTFWSDRIGPTAAIASINQMEKIKSWKIVKEKGQYIKYKWKKLFDKYSLRVDIWGLNAIIGFNFISENNLKYKTYITQELLKKNILAANLVYVSVAHKKDDIDRYFFEFEKVIKTIKSFEDGLDPDKFIENKIANRSFKRLN
tara:strand:- start:5635 stop:7671 length:2037 start_codon:yes stop_codon:yes gene_type:complete